MTRQCVRRVVNLSGRFVGCCDTRGLTYPLFHLFVWPYLGRGLLTDLDLSVYTAPAVYDGDCVRSVFRGFAPDNDTAPLAGRKSLNTHVCPYYHHFTIGRQGARNWNTPHPKTKLVTFLFTCKSFQPKCSISSFRLSEFVR